MKKNDIEKILNKQKTDNTPTPHINAKKKDFAPTVIMAGDPLRVKYIADNYLVDARLVNTTRNMLGYTGYYKGKRISVMGHGMGMPSMMIYGYELYNFYDVKTIIRVGTCGGLTLDKHALDVVMSEWAYTPSNINKRMQEKRNKICATQNMLDIAHKVIEKSDIKVDSCGTLTFDVFDCYGKENMKKYVKKGCKVVEMEVYMLYLLAEKFHKNALSFLTVSDNALLNEEISAEDRQTALDNMIKLALDVAIKIK